jgi:hypothetical protein
MKNNILLVCGIQCKGANVIDVQWPFIILFTGTMVEVISKKAAYLCQVV